MLKFAKKIFIRPPTQRMNSHTHARARDDDTYHYSYIILLSFTSDCSIVIYLPFYFIQK